MLIRESSGAIAGCLLPRVVREISVESMTVREDCRGAARLAMTGGGALCRSLKALIIATIAECIASGSLP